MIKIHICREKNVVTLTADEIRAKIEKNGATIEEYAKKAKELRLGNRKLAKDLKTAEKMEKEAAEKAEMEEILKTIKESGKSLEEIKELLK